MIGIVFYYEQVVAEIAPIYDQLLDRVCYNGKHFGATHILLIDGSSNHVLDKWKKGYGDSEVEIELFDSLNEIEKKYKDIPFVYLENKNTFERMDLNYVDIKDFNPPENIIYVSGQNYDNVNWIKDKKGYFVNISINDMFSDTACLIALYERNR